jgi:hypothetical protein
LGGRRSGGSGRLCAADGMAEGAQPRPADRSGSYVNKGGGRREEAGGRRPGAREEAGEDTCGCVFRRCAAGGEGGGRRLEAACSGGACVCLDRERGDLATARGRKSPKGPLVPVAVKNRY